MILSANSDFHLLTGATQELAKKLEVQDLKVAALEKENAELRKPAGEVSQINALVAALEGKTSETVTVSLNK